METVTRWVKPEDYRMLASAWPNLNRIAGYLATHKHLDVTQAIGMNFLANQIGMNRANLQRTIENRPGFVQIKKIEGKRLVRYVYYIDRFYAEAFKVGQHYPREFSKLAHLNWPLEIEAEGFLDPRVLMADEADITMPVKLPVRAAVRVQCVDGRGNEVTVLGNVAKLRPVLDSVLANIMAGGVIDIMALDQCLVTLVSVRQLLSENVNNPEFKFILDSAFPLELESEATNE